MDTDRILDRNHLTTVVDIRLGLSSHQILSPHIKTTTDQVLNLPQAITSEHKFLFQYPQSTFAANPINEVGFE